jgi:hypothetical protein
MSRGQSLGRTHVDITARQTEFEKGMMQASRRLEDFGKKAAELGKSMSIRFSAPIVGAMALTLKAWQSNERAAMKLNNALTSAGFTDYSSKINETAEAIQRLTTASAASYKELVALGVAGGLTAQQAEETGKAAIGLSKVFGIDTATATRLLTQELLTGKSGLDRYIPELRNAGSEAERMALLQEKAAEGMRLAQAETSSWSGAVAQLRNEVADAAARIGEVLAPTVTRLSNFMKNLVIQTQGIDAATIGWSLAIAGAVAAMGPALLLTAALAKSLAVLAAVGMKLVAFFASPWIALLAAGAAAFAMFTDHGERFLAGFTGPKVAASIRMMGASLAIEAGAFAAALVDGIVDLAKFVPQALPPAFRAVVFGLDTALQDIIGRLVSFLRDSVNEIISLVNRVLRMNIQIIDETGVEKALKAGAEKGAAAVAAELEQLSDRWFNRESVTPLEDGLRAAGERWKLDVAEGSASLAEGMEATESVVEKLMALFKTDFAAAEGLEDLAKKLAEINLTPAGGTPPPVVAAAAGAVAGVASASGISLNQIASMGGNSSRARDARYTLGLQERALAAEARGSFNVAARLRADAKAREDRLLQKAKDSLDPAGTPGESDPGGNTGEETMAEDIRVIRTALETLQGALA